MSPFDDSSFEKELSGRQRLDRLTNSHTRAAKQPRQHCLAKHNAGFLESVIRETGAHGSILAHSHTHAHAVAFPSSAKFSGRCTSETKTLKEAAVEWNLMTSQEER